LLELLVLRVRLDFKEHRALKEQLVLKAR